MSKKKIYLVSVVPSRDQKWTPSSTVGSGPSYVYGDEALQRIKDAAKAASVKLTVRDAPDDLGGAS